MLDRLLGAADQLHRREVRGLHVAAPADGPVLLEEERLGAWMPLEGLRDFPRDEEARPAVRQRDDGVRVRVDDRGGGQEAVQERLDGGARARRLLQGMREVVDHLLIAHVLALEQRQHVVHADAGKVLLLDALEIGARSLDAEHADLAAAVVPLRELDRGVAAAPHHERGLGADEPRAVHEKAEAIEIARGGLVPARVHGDTITETARTLKMPSPLAARATRQWRTRRSPWPRWRSASRPAPATRAPR